MPRFIPIQEVVKLPLLGNDDYFQRGKGRMLTWSKYVWEDMQLDSVRIARREVFHINKRTNTIDLPCDFLQLCSVNVFDRNGILYPVFRNDKFLHDDIVDLSAKKDCACEFRCGFQLCNVLKGYEAIQSVKSDLLPNSTPISFNCVDRIVTDRNGFVYKQTQYPLRVYISGVWTDTVLYTQNDKLCECEIDSNGCICDTEQNINNVCNACGISSLSSIPVGGNSVCPPQQSDNTWIYYCNTKFDWLSVQCGSFPFFKHGCSNLYNISELQDRLIFPHNFGFDKVLIRYYADTNLKDLQIPFIAVDTFVTGLKWWDCRFNDKKQKLSIKYEQDYAKMKFGLFLELNKYRIAEMREVLTPNVNMPSYVRLYPHDRGWEDTTLW